MGYTPSYIIVNRDISDSSIEASFTLNSKHVVRFTRVGKFAQQIRLSVDGSEISNANVAVFTYLRWPFRIDGVDCLFTFNLRGSRASGKLEVGGTSIFTI